MIDKKVSLSEYAIDFLQSSKTTMYDTISHMPTYDQNIAKKESLEFGNGKKVPLDSEKTDSEEYQILRNININRKSTRNYTKCISFEKLSNFLLGSYFVKHKKEQYSFNIPSGGGLYPIDIYVLNLRIEQLSKSLYYYNPFECNLQTVKSYHDKEILDILENGLRIKQRYDIDFENASAIIIFGAKCERTVGKYADRGLRYVFFEVGSILQNMYLNATTLDIGICASGGYIDDYMRDVIGFKDKSSQVLLTAVIG